MEDPTIAIEVRENLAHHDAGGDGVAALPGPGVAAELELVGAAVGRLALDAEGVAAFDGGADAVDVGGGELEAPDAVATVEGEAGEGGAEGAVGLGWGGGVGGGVRAVVGGDVGGRVGTIVWGRGVRAVVRGGGDEAGV